MVGAVPGNFPVDVSRGTMAQLENYVSLLLQWNRRINLIGKQTESEIWERHIIDSAQLLPLLPQTPMRVIDYGSGAGLPGLILALCRPDIKVVCCEQDKRKSAFLLEAKRQLSLDNVTIQAEDVALVKGVYEVVTARAFTSLDKLLKQAIHHLASDGICLFPKGKTYNKEIEEASLHWKFSVEALPSQTDAASKILIVKELINIIEMP